MKQQSQQLGKDPIPGLMAKLAVPATVGLFVMAFYNVVDTIYISRGVGTIGVAAVAIAFPVQMIVMALAGAIGIGGASLISRSLGANDLEKANRTFGNVLTLILIVSITGAVIALTRLDSLLHLFGASSTILPFAREYLGIILYGTFFFAFAFCVNNIVRAEGNAKTAMITMILSAVLNIIFTPVFIFGFNMGIRGAALGTVVAQGITAVYLVAYFLTGKSTLSVKLAFFRLHLPLVKEILAVGASAFVRQGSASIMFIVANHTLVFYGGDLAVAVFGIVHRVMMFSLMPVMGIVQGTLPLVGFNYGARQPDRVNESVLLAIKAATAIALISFILVMAFSKQMMMIFTPDSAAVHMGQGALRIIFALSFTIGVQMVTGGVFQALGKAKAAFVLSLSRQVLFLIPLLLVMPRLVGLQGVWFAFPMADFLSFALVFWFIKGNREIFFALKDKRPTFAKSQ